MSRIPKHKKSKGFIPATATQITAPKVKHPVFSFRHTSSNHCLLSDWQGTELLELIDTFKKMESLTWNEVLTHKGLQYKVIDKHSRALPPEVSKDVSICEIRICQRKRVFGYRIDDVFRVIWFDRNHEICPEGKQRRA